MRKITFTKMEGLGNDFIMIYDKDMEFNNESELTKKLCHRNFGIGGDGVIFIRESKVSDIKMVIYNADGSHASMCGNGIRCFAKYVWDKNIVRKNPMDIETDDGIKTAKLFIENDLVSEVEINMGKWEFDPKEVPADTEEEILDRVLKIEDKEYRISSLHMGVPHTVVYTDLNSVSVEEGAKIEKHKLFYKGTNVNFCEKIDENNIKVRTWERGAGATLACGTGSCASVVVGNKLGLINDSIKVQVPGGELFISLKEGQAFMRGKANIVFEGEINI